MGLLCLRWHRLRWSALRRAGRVLSSLCLLDCTLLCLYLRLMQQFNQTRKECADHFRFPKTSRVACVSSLRRLKSPRTSPGLRPMRSLPTS